MKIAILELEYHLSVLSGIAKIFEHPSVEVGVFALDVYCETMENSRRFNGFQYFPKKTEQTTFEYLSENIDRLNAFDCIIFNTIAGDFKTYCKFEYKPYTLWRVHNAQSELQPLKGFYIKPRPLYLAKASMYLLKNVIIKRDWLYKKRWLKKVDAFSVLNESVMNHILKSGMAPKEKAGPVIPFSTSEGSFIPMPPASQTLTVAVTNSLIDPRRKDYDVLSQALQTLNKQKLKRKLRLIIFGQAKDAEGKTALKKIEKQASKQVKIETPGFLSVDEFDDFLAQTEMLIAPIIEKVNYTVYLERYGKTKETGAINDLYVSARITAVPSSFSLPGELRPLLESYRSAQELADLIQKYLNRPELAQEKYRALKEYISKTHKKERYIDALKNAVMEKKAN